MKTMKKQFLYLVLLGVFMCFAPRANSQVTIGDDVAPKDYSILELSTKDVKGGLRLPQLSNTERTTLTAKLDAAAVGLAIYNTTTNCINYWNGSKWLELCQGSASMTTTPGTLPTVPSNGGETAEITVSSPSCDIAGSFSFTIIGGGDYASINIVSAIDGKFTVEFQENNSALARKAIIMLTDPCGENSTFVFTQTANTGLCDANVTVPTIKANGGSNSICTGGALQLYLDGAISESEANNYIWTLNNVEVGRGANYQATVAGTYTVYYGAIGCDTGSKSISITNSGTSSNAPTINVMVHGNNGFVCDDTGTVRLVAVSSADESKIVWFKDGILQSEKSGQSDIQAGVGTWKAAVKDGDCFGYASNEANVQVSSAAGAALALPQIEIDGRICTGGTFILKVTNTADYTATPGVGFRWYLNNTLLGEGAASNFEVPAEIVSLGVGSTVIVRCQAYMTGSCPQESYINGLTLEASASLPTPAITSSTNGIICDGSTTLIVSNAGSYTVNWFETATSTTPIHTGSSYTVSQAGKTYYVELWSAATDACQSKRSSFTTNTSVSQTPILSWGNTPAGDKMNVNEPFTFSVSGLFTDANTTYTWLVDGVAQSSTTNTASISFSSTTNKTVSVTATNSCGASAALTKTITVGTACQEVTAVNLTTSATVAATAGVQFTMTVAATGGTGHTYEWYRNAGTGAQKISEATGASYSTSEATAGTYTFYAKAKATCESTFTKQSANISVTVSANPANMTAGSGSISGTSNFDVAMKNDGGSCGTLADRTTRKHDFSTSNKLTYVFTKSATGTVNDVRFSYVNQDGSGVIQSISAVTNSGNDYTVTVTFDNTLNTRASGKDRSAALKATIYVIYNNGTEDVSVAKPISVQDCFGCGAYLDNQVWLPFMCHNLGADESKDPFIPDAAIHGGKYKWGLAVSQNGGGVGIDQATDQASTSYSNWSSLGTPPTSTTEAWNMKTQNPCPAGWRLPTKAEWTQIINTANNPEIKPVPETAWPAASATNFATGLKIGEALFLPSVGYRNATGALNYRGGGGYYWSSTQNTTNGCYLFFHSTGQGTGSHYRSYGYSIRCVAE